MIFNDYKNFLINLLSFVDKFKKM